MDLAFTHLTWWLWSRKNQKPRISNGSSMNSSTVSGVLDESDILRFPLVKQANVPSSSRRRMKPKWNSKEEIKVEREYDDVVVVPSDGECVSDSESDHSDWSIGWLEPHGAGFSTDDDQSNETDNTFAVLVPCYGRNYGGTVKKDSKSNSLSNIESFPDGYSDDSKKYVENWLSSLRNI